LVVALYSSYRPRSDVWRADKLDLRGFLTSNLAVVNWFLFTPRFKILSQITQRQAPGVDTGSVMLIVDYLHRLLGYKRLCEQRKTAQRLPNVAVHSPWEQKKTTAASLHRLIARSRRQRVINVRQRPSDSDVQIVRDASRRAALRR
jgi:hypothetical protein